MATAYGEGGLRGWVGPIGNLIYYFRKGKWLVRSKPAAVENPQTAEQQEMRAYLTQLLIDFKAFTAEQRALWAEWVGTLPEPPNTVTESPNFFDFPFRGISAFNGYASVLLRLLRSGFGAVTTPPGDVQPGPDVATAVWNVADIRINVELEWNLTLPSEEKCRVILKGQGLWKGNPVRIMGVSDELEISEAGTVTASFPLMNWKIGHGAKIEWTSIATNLREHRFAFQAMAVLEDGKRTGVSPMMAVLVPEAP